MLDRIVHDGDVLELRLARPPANALDPGLIAALRAAVEGAPAAGARAIVLSGRPGMFSGGLDVPALLPLSRAAIGSAWQDFYGLMAALARSTVPVAAAVTGHSPAGGAVLAIWCDHRVMAEGDFRIGLNEVRVGLPIPPVIFRGFQRLIGDREAERLGVAGLLVPAAEALRIGLVDELAPVDEVVPRALEWCRSLLALPPGAMAETRVMARRGLTAHFDQDAAAELETLVERWLSAETQGAMRGLVAKLAAKRG